MTIMAFMESMSMNGFPLIAAFFIGLMTALSPCPLATNITAIAYISKKIGNGKRTLLKFKNVFSSKKENNGSGGKKK